MPETLIAHPVARRQNEVQQIHGREIIDPYAWLRNREDSEVLSYLKAENAHTRAVMLPTEPLQERLYREMLARIQETDQSVPTRIDENFYYSRTEEGREYPIYCRRQGSPDASEDILLDLNELAVGQRYLKLGIFRVSPDHRLLAYSLDLDGSERFTIRIKDLTTGELLADEIANTSASAAWSNDSQTLYYATLDKHRRPDKAFRHVVGQSPAEDVLEYHESDERFFLSLFKTRSRRFLGILLASKVTTEIRWLEDVPAPSPMAGAAAGDLSRRFEVLWPRSQGVEYLIEHHSDFLYILTNEAAKNFRLLRAPLSHLARESWQEILPHREDVKLEGIDAFHEHLVVYKRSGGLRNIQIIDLKTGEQHDIEFEEPVYTTWPQQNFEYKTTKVRFAYSSMITPTSIYDYTMDTRHLELRKRQLVKGFDRSLYRSERLFAIAEDGVEVPVSLVYREDRSAVAAPRPTLLYGYGAYGASMDPRFSATRLSLLDRGFVYAIAHVRGGGELGRGWYEDGKLFRKKNTFGDFIAAARHLIALEITSPDRLTIRGGSAGGMLIGAVLNMAPELFFAAIAEVPFVDVINTMLDPTLPLTVVEYEEWGDPREPATFEYIQTYSPYDNVEPRRYPHLLVTAGLNDPRVQYWEPAKWVAKLRSRKSATGGRLLLKVNMDSGHSGASGRYGALREEAFKQAFLLDVLGWEE